MGGSGRSFSVSVDDVSIDEEGRVSIKNPEIAGMISEAAKKPPVSVLRAANNCYGANCSYGCGSGGGGPQM